MNDIDHVAVLGENIRALREQHGLSLNQLSERSGVAKATLFKIERARTNATVETLVSIANALNVSMSSLFTLPPTAAVDVVKFGTGEPLSDASTSTELLRNQVTSAGTMEMFRLTIRANHSVNSAPHGPGSREHVFVRSGRLRVGPTGDEVELEAGDYCTYPTDGGHLWESLDGEPAEAWVINTLHGTSGTFSQSF